MIIARCAELMVILTPLWHADVVAITAG